MRTRQSAYWPDTVTRQINGRVTYVSRKPRKAPVQQPHTGEKEKVQLEAELEQSAIVVITERDK